ncbi:RNA-binding S4 domain-containing protein [Fervidibacter sacchari]|jgi:Ribosome-associated heat shock protein implicated in the recycling of the 50S subunit (S4 paralog)|uniref:RQC P-site tRNA stabilizing factor n=1 Tax=Candidatus Fervidibacter sacchari TaxID=1448929 RepID=A0ABT2ERD7_9BACT|nr:RNA-binding S4 domain-containing protein [Candidatus Fervidibacter sacchari]MCS3920527.1 ribosomal 50S subunit-recycling heat shock protein [Candidatus Fervidibacter sacchari]WKU14521.1 RNA-binding S4 domain-containing protein [Candidatus Fervidibacter sacchari]
MRLDKFLQLTGLVKRRTLAKELCDAGRIKVNGKVAKPSTEVRIGDLIEGEVGWERWEVRVLQIPKGSVPSNRRSEFVEVIRRERISLWEEI